MEKNKHEIQTISNDNKMAESNDSNMQSLVQEAQKAAEEAKNSEIITKKNVATTNDYLKQMQELSNNESTLNPSSGGTNQNGGNNKKTNKKKNKKTKKQWLKLKNKSMKKIMKKIKKK